MSGVDKPSIDDVRALLVKLLQLADHGWIGEGDQVAEQLLEYIDGDRQAFDSWQWHDANIEPPR